MSHACQRAGRYGMLERLMKLKEPLYHNSLFMILASLASSGFGFLFWLIAARLYGQDEVGTATAILSSAFLIVSITRLGLDQSVIRFFPDGDRGAIIGSALVLTTVLSIVFGLVFVVGIDLWSPGLDLLQHHVVEYVALIVLLSAISTTASAFSALRRSSMYFYQTVVTGLRVPILFAFIGMGAVGIFLSMEAAIFLAVAFSFLAMAHLGVRPKRFDLKFLKESYDFSIGSYIGGLLINAPASLLPIMVLNSLGAVEAANYYMTYAIVSILVFIPWATSTSLFVEVSNGEALGRTVKRSLVVSMGLLAFFVVATILFGGVLLGLIGEEYESGGLELLQIMALSTFPQAIYMIFQSVQRIKRDMRGLIIFGGASTVLLLILSQIFMGSFGLVGVGASWLLAYSIIAIPLLPALQRVVRDG